jgi:hypothetical protein
MANLKWVNVSVDLDKLQHIFQIHEVQRQLVKKLGKGQLLHLAYMCVGELKSTFDKEHKSFEKHEVLSTFDGDKSVSWAKSCKTRQENARNKSIKCKQILESLNNLQNND